MHEHWNDATNKQYSRNLGTGLGIELAALTATRPDAVLAVSKGGTQALVSWQGSLTPFRLQSSTNMAVTNAWSNATNTPALIQARSTVTNDLSAWSWYYRLIK